MPRKRKIPNRPDFRRATRRAYDFLIELDIRELPVDPFAIVKLFEDRWHLFSWTELRNATGEKDPLNLKKNKAEAKTKVIRGTNEYLIVYDNENFSRERIRWTIAHEIGHIVLGHLVYYEETALNRGGLTNKEYGVLEVEAHWFAESLLAPNFLLHVFSIKDNQEISFLCDISKESSEKCSEHLESFYSNDYDTELKLLRNFYDFFYENRFLQSIAEGIYKFHGSFLYDGFYKICRICRSCNGYVINQDQEYCHICGNRIPDWDWPFEQLPINGIMRGWPEYLKGKFYPSIETDSNGRVLYCVVCGNQVFSENAAYCKVCGSPVKNICLDEEMVVSGECRHCPDCGGLTKFEESGLFDKLKEIEVPDLLTLNNGSLEDYIEYEYWHFIIATVYYFEKNLELYTALAGTRAVRDEGGFVIFAPDAMSRKVILDHKGTLMKCIRKYGQTIIEEVRCYCDL